MLGDLLFTTRHYSRKGFADLGGESLDKSFVEFRSPFGLTLSATRPQIGVSKTLVFRQFKRYFFDQKPLSLVSPPGSTPFQDDGGQKRMFARAPGQRCIAGRKKDEMIQIRARQAQRAFVPDQ